MKFEHAQALIDGTMDVADLPPPEPPPPEVLACWQELACRIVAELRRTEKETHRALTRRCLEIIRERGHRYTNYPGYGYRWSSTRHRQRRLPDHQERAVMAQIVGWRADGWSWYKIARHLLYARIRTRDGREWSTSRVQRAYQAELKLRGEAGKSPAEP